MTTIREEWRVTGQPSGGYPPYSFVFGGPNEADREGTPEHRARRFIAMTSGSGWLDGPHLEHRTITETEWQTEA